MAKKTPVNTQMDGSKVPDLKGVGGTSKGSAGRGMAYATSAGGIPVHTHVDLGEKAARTITPTQTAGADTRTPRPGTVQRKFGTSNQ